MALTPTWVVFNLVFPVILPPISMYLAGKFMASTTAEKANAAVLRTVQEGQLGWVAIAWCALALYEAWEKLETRHDLYGFVIYSSVGLLIIIFGSIFISVGGAMTAPDKPAEQKKYAGWSIITAIAAGVLFSLVHWKVS
jgi:hypothetical protein